IEFMDNAKGQWKPYRGWRGTFTENVVQAIARDLLAEAISRAEARWPGSVVFHCHDELVIEAPIGTIPEQDVLALLIEPPVGAGGLQLGGKAPSSRIYLEAPKTPALPTTPTIIELAVDTETEIEDADTETAEIPDTQISAGTPDPLPWGGDSVFANLETQ